MSSPAHLGQRMSAALRASLIEPVGRDHRQTAEAFRRRRLVTAVFTVAGAVLLGLSLNAEPGSSTFYVSAFGLPGLWAVGAWLSGPLHLGREIRGERTARPLLTPISIGAGLAVVFVLGALVVREFPLLSGAVESVLDLARDGSWALVLVITAINGIAEELFFRGALYAAVRDGYQVPVTTIVYAAAVTASGNGMLGFAALLLGAIVGLQRRASGGVLAPMLTHVTWSVSMLCILPALF